jgi:hypothetical protein
MIASSFTYLPPIWLSTSAYSFSAPIALMVVSDAAGAEADVPLDEADDQQALASRAAASGRATARAPVVGEAGSGGRAHLGLSTGAVAAALAARTASLSAVMS